MATFLVSMYEKPESLFYILHDCYVTLFSWMGTYKYIGNFQ